MSDWSQVERCPECGAGNPRDGGMCVGCGVPLGDARGRKASRDKEGAERNRKRAERAWQKALKTAWVEPNVCTNLRRYPNQMMLVHFMSFSIGASKLAVLDLRSNEIRFKENFEEEEIGACDLSYDGNLLLVGFSFTKSLKLIDVRSGNVTEEFAINGIEELQASTDGSSFLFRSTKPVDIDFSRKHRGTFLVRNRDVGNAKSIPNAAELAFGHLDHHRNVFYLPTRRKGQVAICDFRSGQVQMKEVDIDSTVCVHAWPDGELLVLDDGRGRLYLYDLGLAEKRLEMNFGKLLRAESRKVKFRRYSCTYAREGTVLVLSQKEDDTENSVRVIVVDTADGRIVDNFTVLGAGARDVLEQPSTGDLAVVRGGILVDLKKREVLGRLCQGMDQLLRGC